MRNVCHQLAAQLLDIGKSLCGEIQRLGKLVDLRDAGAVVIGGIFPFGEAARLVADVLQRPRNIAGNSFDMTLR